MGPRNMKANNTEFAGPSPTGVHCSLNYSGHWQSQPSLSPDQFSTFINARTCWSTLLLFAPEIYKATKSSALTINLRAFR